MATETSTTRETEFNRKAWLTLLVAVILLLGGLADLAYRFTLPTDGWQVTTGEGPGFVYTKNLLGNPSGLQPGDQVTALEGIPAEWQTIRGSATLRGSWRTGATLDYTVLRQGKEIHIPVTLAHWQIGKWLRALMLDPVKMAGNLSVIVLQGLAFFVFLRRPGDSLAGAFLLLMTILAAIRVGESLPLGFVAWIDPVVSFVQNTVNWTLLEALFPFALINFSLLFPRPKPIYQRRPWLPYSAGAFGLFLAVSVSGSPVIGWFWFVLSLILAVSILIHNALTMRDVVSRAQMRWGLGGLIIGFGTLALMFLVGVSGLYNKLDPAIFDVTFTLALTVMGIMLAIAVTRYRLFDIDIIIRKTVIYAVLTGLLGLVYFGAIVVLQGVFEAVSGEQPAVTIVISTLIIAALFGSLRQRVQNFIDRRFYRRKYDAQRTLAAFAQFGRDETDLAALSAELHRVVSETLQPERATIWLKEVNQ